MVSAPTTSARVARPPRMNWSAVATAYTKPLHTACTSKAAQPPRMPSLSCRITAVAGNIMSGVVVATMMRSMSSGVRPAASSARRLACSARSLVASFSATIWRSRMPVRLTIHSSVVSTRFSRSALVSTISGR